MRLLLAIFTFLFFAVPAYAAPVHVVASFSVLGDLVKQVGGENVIVTTLVGPDGDTHTYQPAPGDAKNIASAQLVVVNGLGLEGWMDRLIKASGYAGRVTVASTGIGKTLEMEEESHPGVKATDPHAWQDLRNGAIYVQNIATGLAGVDGVHGDYYHKRADALAQQLGALDKWVRAQVAKVPPSKRAVISSHDAFGYFAAAYGVKFMAPVGLSTEDEPSARELKALAEYMRSGQVRALFLENMADPKVVQQLGRETGVALGGRLYADALSPSNGPAATYQDMFKYNVAQLVEAMQKNQ